MVGCSTKASVVIDGQENMALIDSSAQVSSVSSQFYKELALETGLDNKGRAQNSDNNVETGFLWSCVPCHKLPITQSTVSSPTD